MNNGPIIMDEKKRYARPSPLRNSKAVNRPFQSPLRSVLSPGGKVNDEKGLKNSNHSPYDRNLTTPERKINRQPLLLAKKISQEIEQAELNTDNNKERSVDEVDIKKIKGRISAKKRELEHWKQQLLYKKKHESKDLINLTERWLRGCQKALVQLQKDISNNGDTFVEMPDILAQLGIPPKLVHYSVEDCDFE